MQKINITHHYCILFPYLFLTIGQMGPNAHHAQSWYILYSTNRGVTNLKPSSVHVVYWSFQFSLVSFHSVTIGQ